MLEDNDKLSLNYKGKDSMGSGLTDITIGNGGVQAMGKPKFHTDNNGTPDTIDGEWSGHWPHRKLDHASAE